MRARCSQTHSKLGLHHQPTMRTWGAEHLHQRLQFSQRDSHHRKAHLSNKASNLSNTRNINNHHQEVWMRRTHTGQGRADHRQDEDQCPQALFHSILIPISHRPPFLHIKADPQIHARRPEGPKPTRARLHHPCNRHLLRWRKRPFRPSPSSLLQKSFT